jgi:hypothetical protein
MGGGRRRRIVTPNTKIECFIWNISHTHSIYLSRMKGSDTNNNKVEMKCYVGEYTWYIYNEDIFHQLDTLEISVEKCLVDNVVYLNKS